MLADFQNSFTLRLTGKFATNSYLNIPPHLNYFAICTIRYDAILTFARKPT